MARLLACQISMNMPHLSHTVYPDISGIRYSTGNCTLARSDVDMQRFYLVDDWLSTAPRERQRRRESNVDGHTITSESRG